MVADGETVALVADELDEMKDRGAAVEDDGLVFVAVEVDDLFALGDGGQGLRSDAERFEGFGGGVELTESAVDED
jgi:signal transduction histidine kinase